MAILRSFKSPWKCAKRLSLRRGHCLAVMQYPPVLCLYSVLCTNYGCVIFQIQEIYVSCSSAAVNKDMTSTTAGHTDEALWLYGRTLDGDQMG